MQVSRKIASLLSFSGSQSRKWAPVLQFSMSTVSTRKASPRKNKIPKVELVQEEQDTKASSAHPRITGSAVESTSLEDNPAVEEISLDVPNLGQITWHPMVANSVNLIGFLGFPVQLGISSNDTHTAVSVLLNKKNLDLSQLRIRLIFRGDLAQIAACNLRENDHVYVTGQLTGPVDHDTHSKIQVLVNNISYVVEISAEKEFEQSSTVENGKGTALEFQKSSAFPDISSAEDEGNPAINHLWHYLFQNPHKWWDNRLKHDQRSGSFRHKETGQRLRLDQSTPTWVFPKLNSLISNTSDSVSGKKFDKVLKTVASWVDVLENPEQWKDFRERKQHGKLKPNHPNFVQKTTEEALWLDSAPSWVVSELETSKAGPVKAHVQNEKKSTWKTREEIEELWKDFLGNPEKWLDKRLCKMRLCHPDFKHKDTDDCLWIGSSTTPSWVHGRLPPL